MSCLAGGLDEASAIFSTQRQMASSLGIALMATILGWFMPLGQVPADPARAFTGYRWAFAAAMLLGLGAAAFATRPRDEDAATTMYPACRDRGERDAHPTSAVLRDMR
jgi:hypothetical protein